MEILLNYELLKLLREYNKKNKFADEEFMKKAISVILEKRSCRKAVENITIGENAILFERPYYEEETKTLYVKSGMDQTKVVESFFNPEDTINIYNLEVLTYILEVCNEIYQKYGKSTDLVAYLIFMNSIFRTPSINLCGRMASIDAINQINTIASWLPIKDKEALENYIEYEVLSSLLHGYSFEKGILRCPVFKYLNKYNLHLANEGRKMETEEELMIKINDAKCDKTLDEILYLGLPISEENYYNLTKERENITRTLLKKRS